MRRQVSRPGCAPRMHCTPSTEAWKRRLSVITVRTPEPSFDAMINRWSLYQALSCRDVGTRRGLSEQRCVRLSGSTAGCHGLAVRRARARARAHHPRRGTPVRRGGRAALVASAGRARRAHAILRRSRLVAVCRRALRASHRRRDRAGRASGVHHDAPAARRRARVVRSAAAERRAAGECVRALRAGAAPRVHVRSAWPAADRDRRLERRHESRRRRGTRRERLAGVVPDRDVARFCMYCRCSRRCACGGGASRDRADAYAAAVEQHGWDGEWYRRAYFDDGTPLGSKRKRRMPNRLDRAKLECHRGRWRSPSDSEPRCDPSRRTSCARTNA